MTADEHRAAAEKLLAASRVDAGRRELSWSPDAAHQIAAAQVHATLAQAAEQADLLRGLRSIAQGQADQADAHRAAEIERRGFLGRLFGGGR